MKKKEPNQTLQPTTAEVLEAKRCYVRTGPFSYPRSNGSVYAIVVEDREKKMREGLLRIPFVQWKRSRVDVCWKTGGFTSLAPGVTIYR